MATHSLPTRSLGTAGEGTEDERTVLDGL
jgi:hypothetical protein